MKYTVEELIEVCRKVDNRFAYHHIKSDWGSTIMIMEVTGIAFASLCWYNDTPDEAILYNLSVNEDNRNNRIGTILQQIREFIASEYGMTKVTLSVVAESWMHDWYKRRGYIDTVLDESDLTYIWMEKTL